ncbi:hypothetical protein GCM10027043_46230 [Ferruginibacter profundus]
MPVAEGYNILTAKDIADSKTQKKRKELFEEDLIPMSRIKAEIITTYFLKLIFAKAIFDLPTNLSWLPIK